MQDNENLKSIEDKLNSLEKGNRKSLVTLELIKDFIDKNMVAEEEFKIKKDILEENNNKLVGKIINLLDHFDNIYNFAFKSGNVSLLNSLEATIKMIKSELREIKLEEIKGVGELFDNKLHECIQTKEEEGKLQYEILEVVKKGYIYNGEVIRPAKVIAKR